MNTLTPRTHCEIAPPQLRAGALGAAVAPEMALPQVQEAVVRGDNNSYRLHSILREGRHSTLYRATYMEGGERRGAIIKAGKAEDSEALATEARTLKALLSSDGKTKDLIAPYLPDLIEECDVTEAPPLAISTPASHPKNVDPFAALFGNTRGQTIGSRRAVKTHNALAYNEFVEMVSFKDVRAAYVNGVDAIDSAGMFRRLLMALGLVHGAGFTHGAISMSHVMILPEDHGLVICDWTQAKDWSEVFDVDPSRIDEEQRADIEKLHEEYLQAARQDVAKAARVMLSLTSASMPRRLRSFYRYVAAAPNAQISQAFDLLDDYDILIKDLWGERRFRPFVMPPAVDGQDIADVQGQGHQEQSLATPNHNTKRRP